MKYDFIVLGGTGIQGRICTRDLLESRYSVLVCGRDARKVLPLLTKWKKKSAFYHLDLNNESALRKAIRRSGARVVVNCAELTFNVAVMRACLAEGASCTDLGGLQRITAQQFALHASFQKKGLLCITGCGATPGIANMMATYGVAQLDRVSSIDLGFAWDSNQKIFVVPYSLPSIFAEFRERPVIYQQGKFLSKEPYSLVRSFKTIGTQLVRGIVHSEVYTFPRYFSGIRSVRYFGGFPEHSRTYLEALLRLGSDAPNELPHTLALLKQLSTPKEYREYETIWVDLKGMRNGVVRKILMECFVRTQKGWEDAGSNVDTGRTMSIVSQMLYRGEICASGVHAPEGVVDWKSFFKELAHRKMYVTCNGKRVN